MAKEATEEATLQVEEVRGRWKEDIENAVREARQADERKMVELEERVRVAEEAKRRMEEEILNGATPRRTRMIEAGGDGSGSSLVITADGQGGAMKDDGGPLSLTDLYARLADAEDDLRAEQHENKRLKIYIERIHLDVQRKTPIFRQKQIELESALEELDEIKERLDYARREVVDIRADNQDLEMKNQQMERECRELRRENVDLASQVQRLLHNDGFMHTEDDIVTFDSIQTLQQQNQNLLREHHAMTRKIEQLENHINSNSDKIELDRLKSEVVTLREEREKQAKLVAGIVHQRDLYRALVTKNDAVLIENGAQGQLALADARAGQMPLIEAKNRELVEEVGKLRADLSCSKHEQEALEGRLARVDAHAEELTASNERMRGELTAANAAVARMEIDLSHYRGRCERLEASMEVLKTERDSESRGKYQMEDMNSNLQTHLETARSELAKKEQQFQEVSICFCFEIHSIVVSHILSFSRY